MKFESLSLDQERALYGARDAEVIRCRFDGPADGESAMKETRNLRVRDCFFNLRYPFWHTERAEIVNCEMTEKCRAALWYGRDVRIVNCAMNGIKAVRECDMVSLSGCRIASPEFGWFCRGVELSDCELESEYPFLRSRDVALTDVRMKGKYSFQYVENMTIKSSALDTKDAFWHSKNVTVYDSVIKGEYLAWYSENLRLVRCKVIGTQPLCYCKGLVLEDCEMVDADLAFERSDVRAEIRGGILSVKNPVSGQIAADIIGETILDGTLPEPSTCAIIDRSKS